MAESISFHSRIKGTLGENEDWYRLNVSDDGSQSVEYEWSHTNAYKTGNPDAGQKTVSVDNFLDGKYDEDAKGKLRQLLNDRRVA